MSCFLDYKLMCPNKYTLLHITVVHLVQVSFAEYIHSCLSCLILIYKCCNLANWLNAWQALTEVENLLKYHLDTTVPTKIMLELLFYF